MEYKVCIKCGERKPLEEFLHNKNTCKNCRKIYLHKRWKENALAINEKRKAYRENNKDKVLNQKRDQYARSYGFKDYADLILQRKLREAKRILNNYLLKLYKSSSVAEGKIKRERIKFYDLEKTKVKRQTDLQFRLIDNLRARTRKIFKIQSAKKTTNMAMLIGLSGKEFYEYFLSLGYNKETDTIDHIVPISRFDLTKHEHQLVSCHYLNLRPLPCFENYSKHDSLIDGWQDKIYQICEVRNINPDSIIQHIEAGVACQLSA